MPGAAGAELETISPELILISSPEVAELARAGLPERFVWAADHEERRMRATVQAVAEAPALLAAAAAPELDAEPVQLPVRVTAAEPLEEDGGALRHPGFGLLSPSAEAPRARHWTGSPVAIGAIALVALAALGLSIANLVTHRTEGRTGAAQALQPVGAASAPAPSSSSSTAKAHSTVRPRAPRKARVAPATRPTKKTKPSGAKTGGAGAKTAATGTKPAAGSSTAPPTSTRAPRNAPVRKAAAPTSRPAAKQTKAPGAARGAVATFVPSRVFGWPEQPQTKAYIVRFYRDGKKVYETQSTKPQITLPASFVFAAGHYRWQVVPAPAAGSQQQQEAAAIVDSTFDVSSAAAKAAAGKG